MSSNDGESNGSVIGIDLGTTNSCLAVLERGQASVLVNREGERTTPSVVSFLEDDERLVGSAARRQALVNPDNTVASIKRLIGKRGEEVSDEDLARLPYKTLRVDGEPIRVVINDQELSPEEISSAILSKLKSDAEHHLGRELDSAVITVPAYFNDSQRQATKDAAEIAGLNVLRLINEPTAAALAYGIDSDEDQKILVFDLGGGTFDVSVLEISDGVFEVLATSGDNRLGGDDFDQLIVNWLIAGFKEEKGIDLSLEPAALQRLHEAAERAKIELSSMPRSEISLPFIAASQDSPEHLKVWITRSEMEEMCEPLLERLLEPIEIALSEAGMPASGKGLDHVLLVGGMTRMPAVQSRVSDALPDASSAANHGINPDEAVALGAAIQAGVISGEVSDVLLVDVTPLSLGIETRDGRMSPLIEANSPIPARQTETFTTADDNQFSVEVHVVQGERAMARDNRSLGRLTLQGIPPAQAGVPAIEVAFDIDANGILSVSALDTATGQKREAVIESSTKLPEDQISKMREDAAANRHQDQYDRQIAELRVESESLIRHSESVLDGMDGAERERYDKAVAELREVLEAEEVELNILDESRRALAQLLQARSRKLYGEAKAGSVPEDSDQLIGALGEAERSDTSERPAVSEAFEIVDEPNA